MGFRSSWNTLPFLADPHFSRFLELKRGVPTLADLMRDLKRVNHVKIMYNINRAKVGTVYDCFRRRLFSRFSGDQRLFQLDRKMGIHGLMAQDEKSFWTNLLLSGLHNFTANFKIHLMAMRSKNRSHDQNGMSGQDFTSKKDAKKKFPSMGYAHAQYILVTFSKKRFGEIRYFSGLFRRNFVNLNFQQFERFGGKCGEIRLV